MCSIGISLQHACYLIVSILDHTAPIIFVTMKNVKDDLRISWGNM